MQENRIVVCVNASEKGRESCFVLTLRSLPWRTELMKSGLFGVKVICAFGACQNVTMFWKVIPGEGRGQVKVIFM